jgi:hypothetical protein
MEPYFIKFYEKEYVGIASYTVNDISYYAIKRAIWMLQQRRPQCGIYEGTLVNNGC